MVGRLEIEVVQDRREGARRITLALPANATIADAVAASGWFAPDACDWQAGVHGRVRHPDDRLADGDRVELYRDLLADPKQARRQRAKLRRR